MDVLTLKIKLIPLKQMKNETIKNMAKETLKDLLAECTEGQQLMFKRMYCHKNLDLPIGQ